MCTWKGSPLADSQGISDKGPPPVPKVVGKAKAALKSGVSEIQVGQEGEVSINRSDLSSSFVQERKPQIPEKHPLWKSLPYA